MIEFEQSFLQKVYHRSKCFGWYYRSFDFQVVSLFEKLDSKFESFFPEELKILNNNLIQYVHVFFLIYPL